MTGRRGKSDGAILPMAGRELWGAGWAWLDLMLARRFDRIPRHMPLLYMELTQACNLSCAHCGYQSYLPEIKRELLETNEIVAIMDESRKLKTRIVSFGGGEPFLRDDIFELILEARKLGLAVHINSNGRLLNEERVRRFANVDGLCLVLSLDHSEPSANDRIRGEGTYEAVASAVARVKRLATQVRIGLNCVISPANVGSLPSMVELAADWGVDSVHFTPAHANLNHHWKPSGLKREFVLTQDHAIGLKRELLLVLQTASRLGTATGSTAYLEAIPTLLEGGSLPPCYAGYIYGNIDPYGNLFPCYDHIEALNVRDGGLLKAWRSPEMQRMRRQVRDCSHPCWNTGNAEPSLRMNLPSLLRSPKQILKDMELYLP